MSAPSRSDDAPVPVGVCERCGVTFLGTPAMQTAVAEVLRVHVLVCPGGGRHGEQVQPFPPDDAE